MRYYIEVEHPTSKEIIAGEMFSDNEISQIELNKHVMDFAEEHKICAGWAIDHCMWKLDK